MGEVADGLHHRLLDVLAHMRDARGRLSDFGLILAGQLLLQGGKGFMQPSHGQQAGRMGGDLLVQQPAAAGGMMVAQGKREMRRTAGDARHGKTLIVFEPCDGWADKALDMVKAER